MSPNPAGKTGFISRAWPLPQPKQDNHIRILQPDIERGKHPVAGSSSIVNGYCDTTSANDTLREGSGFLGAEVQLAALKEAGRLRCRPSGAICAS